MPPSSSLRRPQQVTAARIHHPPNTGTATWSGRLIHLCSRRRETTSRGALPRPSTSTRTGLTRNRTGLQLRCGRARRSRTYTFQWQMLREGVAWFGPLNTGSDRCGRAHQATSSWYNRHARLEYLSGAGGTLTALWTATASAAPPIVPARAAPVAHARTFSLPVGRPAQLYQAVVVVPRHADGRYLVLGARRHSEGEPVIYYVFGSGPRRPRLGAGTPEQAGGARHSTCGETPSAPLSSTTPAASPCGSSARARLVLAASPCPSRRARTSA